MSFVSIHHRSTRTGLAAAAVLASTVAGVGLAGVSPASAVAPDLTGVVINEVESNSDATHGDWIELYNTNTSGSVDLTGAILSDSDNAHAITIGAVTLPAGGLVAVRVDDSAVTGNFGLGGADSARLFPADATNLATAVATDTYSWTAHATTTYGRNWDVDDDFDGLGDFQTTAYGTFGTANVFPTGAPANISSIRINEVESNGDTANGDWIELYNTSSSPVDISGAMLSDDDNGHVFTVPASTTIAGFGYQAFRVDSGSTSFGLGAPDQARLFAPGDIAFASPVDSLSWSTHAAVTYGRTVPGAGFWKGTSTSTRAAVNQFSSVAAPSLATVKINEVESHGDDTNGDWVELRNTGTGTVDISGAIISDSDNGHVFRVPTGLSLAAGAVRAFRVDDPALPGDDEFGLGDSDSARLFAADANDLNLGASSPVDSRSWTTHATTSYGLNSGGTWTTTNKTTFGAANDFTSTTTPDISWVVINEIESDGDLTNGDWVELYNTSGQTITIGGAKIADDDDTHVLTIPTGTTIAAGGYYTLRVDDPAVTGFFGLGADDAVRFYRAGKTVGTDIALDHHEWEAHAATTLGRTSAGLGDWAVTSASTRNAANTF